MVQIWVGRREVGFLGFGIKRVEFTLNTWRKRYMYWKEEKK